MHWVFQSKIHPGNVCFNFFGNPIDHLASYARGYHAAGKRLAGILAASRGYGDYEGYPILFLYRHALELYMKAIVCRGAQLLNLLDMATPDTSKLFKVHRLSRFLPSVKAVFDGVGWTWDTDTVGMRTFQEFTELLLGIEELDADSYNFRYPTDTEGHPALERHTMVNAVAFARNMDPVLAGIMRRCCRAATFSGDFEKTTTADQGCSGTVVPGGTTVPTFPVWYFIEGGEQRERIPIF